MGYKRILVTLDGSKLSELALQHALQVAAPGAEIHILSVVAEDQTSEIASLASATAYKVTSPEEQWPQVQEPNDPREVDARAKYLRRVSEWLEQAGFEVTVEARPGPVIATILDVAQRGFEAIVMATHGRTGMSKTVLGSVTEAVVRDTPCPVVIVPTRSKTETH